MNVVGVHDGYEQFRIADVLHWIEKGVAAGRLGRSGSVPAVCGVPMPKDAPVVPASIVGGNRYCGACANAVFARHHGKGRPS